MFQSHCRHSIARPCRSWLSQRWPAPKIGPPPRWRRAHDGSKTSRCSDIWVSQAPSRSVRPRWDPAR
eukprot:8967960-Ditylum_brightwellii.AAC.1